MNFITEPLIVFIVFAGIYAVFELIIRRRERLAIIEKMGDKLDTSMLQGKMTMMNIFGKNYSFGALKSGCLIIGVGLGLLIGFFICTNVIPGYLSQGDRWDNGDMIGIVYGASVLLCGGLGLIGAFIVELKIRKKGQD